MDGVTRDHPLLGVVEAEVGAIVKAVGKSWLLLLQYVDYDSFQFCNVNIYASRASEATEWFIELTMHKWKLCVRKVNGGVDEDMK